MPIIRRLDVDEKEQLEALWRQRTGIRWVKFRDGGDSVYTKVREFIAPAYWDNSSSHWVDLSTGASPEVVEVYAEVPVGQLKYTWKRPIVARKNVG